MMAEILPTTFPPNGSFFPISPIWLAYCSGTELLKVTNSMVRPLWQFSKPSITSLNCFTHSTLKWLDREVPLLEECVQYSDGNEYALRERNGFVAVEAWHQYTGPLSNGFPIIKYKVISTITVNGHAFPKEFRLQQFGPTPLVEIPTNVDVLSEYEGRLDNIVYGYSRVSPQCALKQYSPIVDYRTIKLIPPLESVTYSSPSDTWLPMIPGYLPHDTYKKVIGSRLPQQDINDRRPAIRLLLLVLFSLPLVFLLKKFLSSKQNSEKTQQLYNQANAVMYKRTLHIFLGVIVATILFWTALLLQRHYAMPASKQSRVDTQNQHRNINI
jgi:hypothetical protein